MAENTVVDEGDGGNDEMVKRSSSKKSSGSMDSQLEALPEWLWAKFASLLAQEYKEQSFCHATQGSHCNQSLQKLTLHIYNKLSSHQVRRTYKLSWYHSTLSSNVIWALILLSMALLFWWHFRTKFFNYGQGRLAYQASLYILQAYLPLH